MDIMVGRMSRTAFITKHEMVRYKRNFHNVYLGEKNIVQDIAPVSVSSQKKAYSSLYMFDPQSAEFLPFDWMYFVSEKWLSDYRNGVYNHSFSNDEEFEKFVNEMQFPILNDEKSIVKERNHLLTELSIPFENIERIMVKRSDPDYCRTISHIRKNVNFFEEKPISKYVGSRIVPTGIEFIIK